ncbi:MAG TPA: serine/threonine-protein kinase, partial [Kofleriaceae bacterium]
MKLTAVEVRDPNVLGDFVLGDKLGEGGFGTVYLAEQRTLGRAAVVKVIRKSLVAHRDAADRFALEARLASRFDHPYAAHVYAFGTEPDGSMWIAMELVKGTPLNELVDRGGPIPLERFVPLMERLCDVVQAAHEQQIVHRDIKPSNVMVIARAGRLMPKLLDFGIAKALTTDEEPPLLSLSSRIRAKRPSIGKLGLEHTMEASASDPARETRAPDIATDVTEGSASPPGTLAVSGSLTRAGQILGSPPYMAPEQWADAGRVGPWTDQYALALLAYEAIVGKRAFVGTSLEAFREAHATAPLPALPRHLPPKLHAVLARATAKDPTQRFESLTELSRAFREAAQGAAAVDEGPAIALPPALRALWMDRAPAPIAEAIAMLATARTPGRVIDRARGTAALLARWIGVVALACQSRLGRLVPGTPTHELVLATRRRALRDVEWLDLAAAVTQPMIARPEAWPIPELANFAHDAGIATLRSLLEDDRAGAADGIDRAIAEDSLARLATVLEGASWLLEYTLARAVERGLELWTGVAGEERAVRPASGRMVGEIVVLDADGAPVVRLSPLVQIAAPLPEHAEEVFVFAGPGRDPQASRAVAYPRGFERDDHETWDWFASHLLED